MYQQIKLLSVALLLSIGFPAICAAEDSATAHVILEVPEGNPYRAGFQLLLDSNHDTYGSAFFETSQTYYGGDYSQFEYSIPEDADCKQGSQHTIIEGEGTVDIPAGIYDMMVVSAEYTGMGGYGMIIINGLGRLDDFNFQGGQTYRFIVENPEDLNERRVVVKTDYDAAILGVTLPDNGVNLSSEESITAEVNNNGLNSISGFQICYAINGGTPVKETYDGILEPGETVNYTFAEPADFSAADRYEVDVWVELDGDLVPINDRISSMCIHFDPLTLPFFYDFSEHGQGAFDIDWIVINADNDDSTWSYENWSQGVDGISGAVSCYGAWSGDCINDDWLITLPLKMEAGAHNVEYFMRGSYNTALTDDLDVCIGESPMPEAMKVLSTEYVNGPEWTKKVVNFDVDADGIYYVGFHYKMENGGMCSLDNISVNEGNQSTLSELKVGNVILPVSNCDLSDETIIGVELRNKGTGAASSVTLECEVKVNDTSYTVEETIDCNILPSDTEILYLSHKFDFSETGIYVITVNGTADGTEIEGATGRVEALDPTPLPIYSQFWNNDIEDWEPLIPGNWKYDDWGTFYETTSGGKENGLISHCFESSNPVRVKLTYSSTSWNSATMQILFGKSGAPIESFVEVFADNNITETKEAEFYCPVEEPDSYNLLIVNSSTPGEYRSLRLYECTISEVQSYDARLKEVVPPVSAVTPADQITDGMPFMARVQNVGLKSVSGVTVIVKESDKEVGRVQLDGVLAPEEEKVVVVPVAMSEVKEGDVLAFTVEVEVAEDEGDVSNNISDLALVTVSDDIRATENASEVVYGIGNSGAPISIGNLYTLAAPDVLTQLQVGFSPTSDEYFMKPVIRLAVYEVEEDMATLGRCLVSKEIQRGAGGFTTIDIDPMLLQPGSYFFEVEQTTYYNMGLGYVPTEGAYCYQNIDGIINRADNDMALMIRGIFGDAVVYAQDVAPVEILYPHKSASVFSSSECIRATVKNMGSETSVFSALCRVNGKEYGAFEALVTLLPYEVREVEFPDVDMAVPGEYEVEILTCLEGDENVANDMISAIFTSLEEANPYVLDFENCDDFDNANDTFNPRWRTVDLLGRQTDGYWKYNHKGRSEPVGFIAFNPSATEPSMIEDGFVNCEPYSGERYGIAFVTGGDWTGEFGNDFHSDVWLISPKLKLGKDSWFSVYARTRLLEYGRGELEPFTMLVSNTTDDYDAFVALGEEVKRAPEDGWEKFSESLSAYDGQEVYVAIRYIGVPIDNVALMVDDVCVETSTGMADAMADGSGIKIAYRKGSPVISIESSSDIKSVEVFTTDGTLLYKRSGNNYHKIPVSRLGTGVVVVRVVTTDSSAISKLMINR